MDPQERFCHNVCHNESCRAYGRAGEGHIVIHSKKESRYRCKRCKRTFSESKGTSFYRVHKPHELFVWVVTLLAHGCPVQAIVAAFSLDERTVWRWHKEAGEQCRRVHEHVVEAGQVDLLQVQADEIRVKAVGSIFWMACAIEVKSRLWLAGVVAGSRDRDLIRSLIFRVRLCGYVGRLLLCTDGLSSYQKQAKRIFRERLLTGRRGRPRLVLPEGVMIAQVIKQCEGRRVVDVIRRVVVGAQEAVMERVKETGRSLEAKINTAYIERLNATFRGRLSVLGRRSRCPARKRTTLERGMWLVGVPYNLVRSHRSLREERAFGTPKEGKKWVHRTPAQAAGLLTDSRLAIILGVVGGAVVGMVFILTWINQSF
jgi:transposase-like protein